mmetsp:Transcript_18406/g.30721  ORF Transcript_18406/g.30721 Transcript_18406/m.30721 type:complete len:134 (+) Transcript_18406:82-483(+)
MGEDEVSIDSGVWILCKRSDLPPVGSREFGELRRAGKLNVLFVGTDFHPGQGDGLEGVNNTAHMKMCKRMKELGFDNHILCAGSIQAGKIHWNSLLNHLEFRTKMNDFRHDVDTHDRAVVRRCPFPLPQGCLP